MRWCGAGGSGRIDAEMGDEDGGRGRAGGLEPGLQREAGGFAVDDDSVGEAGDGLDAALVAGRFVGFGVFLELDGDEVVDHADEVGTPAFRRLLDDGGAVEVMMGHEHVGGVFVLAAEQAGEA